MLLRPIVLLFVASAALGCSAAADSGGPNELSVQGTTPLDWDRPVVRPTSEEQAASGRAACRWKRGAMAAETHGAELPVDQEIPIKHVVVLMQENRSFDSYFGHLNQYAGRTDIESAVDGTTNPERVNDPKSPVHAWQHAQRLCISDTNHEWAGSHLEYDGGKMDGFFQANQGFWESDQPKVSQELLDGERALWWYDERDIPFYYELASTFAIGDHYHSSLLGPTWPNRDYLYAATSRGVTTGVRPDTAGLGYPAHDLLIFDELERRQVSWSFFVSGFLPAARLGTFLGPIAMSTRWQGSHVNGMGAFMDAAETGSLPAVSFIDGNIHEDVYGNDEHPPADIQTGQVFVADVVQALMKSPQWKETALFIVYDEHGGLYDHVAPPSACAPDEYAPDLQNKEDREYPGAFDQLGMRVPVIVVSPYAKRGYVSHHVYDHTSITRFIEAKFKLPALTSRDANADAMYDLFDFEAPPFMSPPKLHDVMVEQDRLDECISLYPRPSPNNSPYDGG